MNQVQNNPQPEKPGASDQQAFAMQVIQTESAAVGNIRLNQGFHDAVELIVTRTGHYDQAKCHAAIDAGRQGVGSLVVGGLGKSGLIGQKLSATFASTGTPSHFLHPSEAMHGDLGKIRKNDIALLLSYGGNTQEVVQLAMLLKQDGVPVVSITSKTDCDLARLAACAITVGDITEACPLNLAPTASTTAMLAIGDALALTVSWRRGFSEKDFHKFHPGGNLGKELMPVLEAIRFRVGVNLPLIDPNMTVQQAFQAGEAAAQSTRRAGALIIVDSEGKLAGIFTDGDLRRHLIALGPDVMNQPIGRLMTKNPKRLGHEARVRDAVAIVRQLRIDEVPVVDENSRPLGLVDVQDLMALKVIEG